MIHIIFLSLAFSATLMSTILALTHPELGFKQIGYAAFFAFIFMLIFGHLSFGRGSKVEGGSASGRASGETKGD